MKDNFIHLHTHTEYSNFRLLDSTIKIKKAIKYVTNTLGQDGLAITDHESLSGHIEFLQTVESLKKSGEIPQDFKPILGNEIYLVNSDVEELMDNNKPIRFDHFLLLAKNKEGHYQLRQLSSRAWSRMRNYRNMERTPTYYEDLEEIVGANKGNIIGSTACLGSKFAQLVTQLVTLQDGKDDGFILQGDNEVRFTEEEFNELIDTKKEEIHNFLTWCIDVFGEEDFYIELQPHLYNEDGTKHEQQAYNEMALVIANAYGIKPIVTTDAHYMTIDDKAIHEAFLTSDEEGGSNREVASFYGTTHFYSSEELHESLHYLDYDTIQMLIDNTKEIADKIEIYSLANNQVIPKIPLSNEARWYKDERLSLKMMEYPNILRMMESDEIYDRRLVSLIQKGFKNRKVKDCDINEKLERINIECGELLGISLAKQAPMSSYFVTLAKMVDIIWEEANCMIGVSRGSGAGWEINYLIGITQISPLEQGIVMPHWRFLSAERPDYADIDLDIPSHKRDHVFKYLHEYFSSFGATIVRVSTFNTESSKSAMQTACRGLGINNDISTYLTSLIPIERGSVWSIEDTYYGNEDKGRKPITEFVNQVNQYEGLLETALGVQNLISGRGVHPCGAVILTDINEYNCVMKATNYEYITQWNLSDTEYGGSIKMDLLNTKTMSMVQLTFEMLVDKGHIKWVNNLRDTYDTCLLPCNIDKDSQDMWDKFKRGEVLSAFQFETQVGSQAVKLIQPSNLLETASANTLMRLMVEDGEQPMDMYIRYKNNIQEWYDDMREFGLNEDEISILEEHIAHDYGVCNTQEGMMMLSMDSRISNFDVVESNVLRKAVAKKKGDLFEKAHKLFYEKGLANGCRKVFLDYIWNVQVMLQAGYSFSILHSIGYSWILIQQLNLVHHYPSIYWNTSVLLVESGAISQEVENEDDNKKEKATNYGVVASAISTLQANGVNVSLPNINIAEVGFIPYEETNSILFGLKGVSTINNDTAQTIIDNRPYASLQDFHERLVTQKREVTLSTGKKQNKSLVSTSQTINLIKAGAFDELEKRPREQILEDYLLLLNPFKKALTSANISKVIDMGIIPDEYEEYVKHYNFKQFINSLNKYQDVNAKSIVWVVIECDGDDELTDYTTQYLLTHFAELVEDRDYFYDEEGYINVAMKTTRKGSFEALYKEKMKPFSTWLNSKECVDLYNHITFSDIKRENMSGNVAHWEMESMNYYYTEHELAHVDKELYSIENFYELSEEPTVVGFTQYKGIQHPKFQLHRIVGTVLDRDKNKHLVTLLTEHGVVAVKFYAGQFSFYDKVLSVVNEDGSKTKVEDSWFKRGNLLMVTGFRRGNQMRPKRYSNSTFQHSLSLITDVHNDGTLSLVHDRAYIE